MNKLEYRCKFTNISIHYDCASIQWPDSRSELRIVNEGDALVGYFAIWAEVAELERIKVVREELFNRVECLILAMQFLGNDRFAKTDENMFYVTETEQSQIANDNDIDAIMRRSKGESFTYFNLTCPACTLHHTEIGPLVRLPQKMPSVPLVLRRHVITMAQAEAMGRDSEHYEDEQIKRFFLIIEEMEPDQRSQSYKDLKAARDFVSHPKCNHSAVTDLVGKEIAGSVQKNSSGNNEVCYQRQDTDHMTFVAKYVAIARQWAKRLMVCEITSKGGSIGP